MKYISRLQKFGILALFVLHIVIGNQGNLMAAVQFFATTTKIQDTVQPIKPTKTLLFDDLGRIDPVTVQSFDVTESQTDTTYCSYITYLNLQNITELGDKTFQRGDAIELWKIAGEKKITTFTGLQQSGLDMVKQTLDAVFRETQKTVFDIVTYSPKLAAHRFIIFLGTDNSRYALDPVRTASTQPLELTVYVGKHLNIQEEIRIFDAFQAGNQKRATVTKTDALVARSAKDMVAYAAQGLITPLQDNMAVIDTVRFQKAFRYEASNGKVTAHIPEGNIIKTYDKKYFDTSRLEVTELSADQENTIKKSKDFTKAIKKDFVLKETIKFGTPNQHLIFSQPIAITLQTPDMEDGKAIEVLVQHEGQPWNTQGLTNNPYATCNADGSVATADQLTIVPVKNKTVTFYTCGASTFALGYVPGIALPNAGVNIIVEQADGKIVIGGTFTTVGGVARNRIARLNADKSLDTTFNPNLVGTNVVSMVVQSDGKIVIGGTFTTVGGVARSNIARLNADGTLDTTYNPNANGAVSVLALQSDGEVVAGGSFTTVGGVARNRIARLNTDGTLDTGFNPNAGNTVIALAIQSDGKIVAGGTFTTVGGVARNRIARLNSDGTLDTTYNPNAGGTVSSLAIQSDSEIIVGGVFTTMGGVARNNIARLNTDGTLDTGFNPNANASVTTIAIQLDGSIIAGGTFTTMGGVARNRIARVTTTGALDTTFNPNSSAGVNDVIIASTGKIIVGGAFTSFAGVTQGYLAYYDNIIHDTVYNVRPSASVNTILTQTDGKIVIGGVFTTVGGVARNRIARLNANGTLDTTYNPNAGGTVSSLAIQSDGEVIVGGTFTTMGGVARNNIARLNTDGTLDTTFNPNANGAVTAIVVQADGKVVIGGAFTTVGGVARNRIARLNSDGTLDTTYNPNAGGTVSALAIQSDGKIVAGGTFTTVGGVARNNIARLNIDGTLDTGFNPNANGSVNAIVLQSTGRIVIGGAFTTIGGVTRNRLARLNTDGTLETIFNPNASAAVNALYLLDDDGIVAGGAFTTIGGVAYSHVVKLFSQGSVDARVSIVFSASTAVLAIGRDVTGDLVVGGSFTSINGNTNTPYFAWIGLNETITTSMSLWLKADSGTSCTTNGCSVSQWNDNSSISNHAIQATSTAQPLYRDNEINFNPVVNFNTTAKVMTNSVNGSYKTIFAVRNLASTSYQTLFASPANTDFSIRANGGFNGTTNLNYTDGPNFADFSVGGSIAIDGKNTLVGKTQYHLLRAVANTGAINSSYSISSTFMSRGMNGNDGVAEMIVYNTEVTSAVRNQIESYLAVKYGLTLDQTTGRNYINSSGIVTWDALQNSGYNKDIFGLGRDTTTTLDQRVAKSSNPNTDLLMLSTDTDFTSADTVTSRPALANRASIIIGNDGASTGMNAVFDGIPNRRISRIWRADTTNMTTGVYVGIQSGAVNIASGSNMVLSLIISSDTTFTASDTVVPFTTGAAQRYAYADIPDGAYVTIASVNNGILSIEAPTTITTGAFTTKEIAQSIDILSDYFIVDDQVGSYSGYYTTLQVSDLVTTGNTISSGAIEIQASIIDLLSGDPNSNVILDTASMVYTTAITPIPFIKRNASFGYNILGKYGAKLSVRVNVPAYTTPGDYAGTITYTLIEN